MTTTREGIDYAGWRPPNYGDPSWTFACRYLSSPGNPKNLTLGEAQALTAAGKDIIVVFETTGTDFSGGRGQGQADAREALREAQACGMPAGRPIFFAIDTGTTDIGGVNNYLQGCADILGMSAVGVYGSFAVCAGAICPWLWQTYAWSGGQVHPGIHLYQYLNGNDYDHDRTSLDDFGQWRIGQTPNQGADDLTPQESQQLADIHLQMTTAWPNFETQQPTTPVDYLRFIDLHTAALVAQQNSRVAGSKVQLSPIDAAMNADAYGYTNAQALQALAAQITGLQTAVSALAANSAITPAELQAMINTAVKENVQITGTVQVGPAAGPSPAAKPAA